MVRPATDPFSATGGLKLLTGNLGRSVIKVSAVPKDRHLIENAFCRLKDFRRVATRYDKLAANFLSGVALATAIAFWL